MEHGTCVESEQILLGCLLINSDAVAKVIKIIDPDVFVCRWNRNIFRAILDLEEEAETVDVVTVTSKLKALGLREISGGPAYLAELLERAPAAAHWECHARALSRSARSHPPPVPGNVNIDLPTWMLEEIDNYAEPRGLSRQAVISSWLVDRLEYLRNRPFRGSARRGKS